MCSCGLRGGLFRAVEVQEVSQAANDVADDQVLALENAVNRVMGSNSQGGGSLPPVLSGTPCLIFSDQL